MCGQMSILQTKGYQDFFSPSSLYITIPLFPHFIIPANHWGRRTKSLLKDCKLWCPCAFSTKWTKLNFVKIQTNTGNFCGLFLYILFAPHLRESVVNPAIFFSGIYSQKEKLKLKVLK